MKATPLLVAWHEDERNPDLAASAFLPIYSAHFEPHGKGRLATAGGDCHVRLWRVEANGEERKITHLSTLKKHTQAVNVVRWCPRTELIASAGDDGNVLLWTPSENPALQSNFGDDGQEYLEHWRVKTMCRSNSGSEIYDLAWSPDGQFFITGSMDNIARIYNASTGQTVRQIAEHNHYVQGVAWDPLNEYIATQSSDRSVHIYSLKTKDGNFSLHNKITKMDLPGSRRISSDSPAPPEFGSHRTSFVQEAVSEAIGSPRPSAPGTPQSLALPMNPPPTSRSRRSSMGSQAGAGLRGRSVSPSPSTMPLPAVMPSASPSLSGGLGLGMQRANIYANETLTSFFRRLTFAPDGSLLFTPAGQYKTSHPGGDGAKGLDDIINTVYIYTRAGFNKPPVAYLPGHKKPSVAVKCSPVFYHLRVSMSETKEITIDTRTEDDISPLPEPAVPSKPITSYSTMDPPPLTSAPSPSTSAATMASPRQPFEPEQSPSTPAPPAGPPPAFGLPYRIVYAVATQDAVHVYDTQQHKPLCVVSNLHYATFTDLTWSSDGQTLLMTSSDGFCSALTFLPGELGAIYHHPRSERHTPAPISVPKANSAASTPQATPTASSANSGGAFPPPVPSMPRQQSISSNAPLTNPNPSPSPFTPAARPASPARSMSASSIGTEASFARAPDQNAPPVMNNPTPSMSSLPPVAATGGSSGGVPLFTPPQTPGHHANGSISSVTGIAPPPSGVKRESSASETSAVATNVVAGVKRDGANVEESAVVEDGSGREKRRRIAPELVSGLDGSAPPPPPAAKPVNDGGGPGGGG